jgi:UDP-N-acetylglucosamine 2-epimerase (hydrolysing)
MSSDGRTILSVTGTRADIGKLKSLIQQVDRLEGPEYRIFATGMHMLARYGSTIAEIYRAVFDRVYPRVNQHSSVATHMGFVLAKAIQGLRHCIRGFPADLSWCTATESRRWQGRWWGH